MKLFLLHPYFIITTTQLGTCGECLWFLPVQHLKALPVLGRTLIYNGWKRAPDSPVKSKEGSPPQQLRGSLVPVVQPMKWPFLKVSLEMNKIRAPEKSLSSFPPGQLPLRVVPVVVGSDRLQSPGQHTKPECPDRTSLFLPIFPKIFQSLPSSSRLTSSHPFHF